MPTLNLINKIRIPFYMILKVFREKMKTVFASEQIVNTLGLLLICLFTASYLTKDVFSLLPPTGGDLGLHFQTVHFLKNIGFSNFTLRLWNPGNFAGEPLLVHYFPLPFILIGLMGFFIELGLAYKIGSFLPIFLLPLSVYFCVKKIGLKNSSPLITAGLILLFLYHETSPYYGSAYSTVNGNFTYAYAICFLFLGLGFLFEALKNNKISFSAICFFSATALSHAYIFIIVPIFFLSSLVFAKDKKQVFYWLKILVLTGVSVLLLSAWFLWPMIDNSQWITPHARYTGFNSFITAFTSSPILYLLYATLFICYFAIIALFVKRSPSNSYLKNFGYLSLWILPSLIYLGLSSTFPKIGLISYQTVYPALLCLIIPFSILYVFLLKDYSSKAISFLLALLNVLLHTLYPSFGFLFVSCFFVFCTFLIRGSLFDFLSKIWRHLFFWILPSLVYLGLFFIFPAIGLVDYRAISPILLFLSIIIGILYAFLLKIYFPKKVVFHSITLLTVLFCILWTSFHVDKLPDKIRYHYSGWYSKENYQDSKELYKHFKSGLSKPRIVSEYEPPKNLVAIEMLFRILPSSISRASLVGLYIESNLLSPAAHYLQDKISTIQECPLSFYLCPENNINTLDAKLELMGVGHLILATQESKEKIQKASYLIEDGNYGPWTLYKTKNPPQLIEPLYGSASIIKKTSGWRHKMNEWFDQYNGNHQWQLINVGTDVNNFKQAIESNTQKDCDTNVAVDFFGFDFETNCLHVPHIVKFAYHGSWKNSANDPIYLVSPGMIGIIPSQNKIRFDFGQNLSWKIAAYISILTFLLGLLIKIKDFIKTRKTATSSGWFF